MKRGFLIAGGLVLIGLIWFASRFSLWERSNKFLRQLPEGKNYQNELDKQKNLYKAGHQVVFLGDSHIEQCEWKEVFPEMDLANRGIGGEGTASLHARLDAAVLPGSQLVVLQIGINDLLSGLEPDVVFEDYQSLILDLKLKECVVIATLPFYTRYALNVNKKVEVLNNKLKDWLPSEGITVLDLSRELSDNKTLKHEFTLDGVHLNAAGYQIWIKALKRVLPPVQPKEDGFR